MPDQDIYDPDCWAAQRRARDQAAQAMEQDARVERIPRMGQTTFTDDERQIAVDNFRGFISHAKITQARLAKMAGLTGSVLSDLLRGRYKGDVDAVIRKVEAAISADYRRRDAPGDPAFVMTGVAKRIFAIIKTTAKDRGIGVFYCVSGVGKTMALEAAIALDFPGGILVKLHPGCASPTNFGRELLAQIIRPRGVPDTIRARSAAFNAIVARLKDSNRLILLDEVDIAHVETLSFIRHIQDATGCPIVLSGRPNLAKKIERTTRCEEIGGSLRGRICIEHDLMAGCGKGGRWLFTVAEVTEIFAKFKVTFAKDAAQWLTMLANLTAMDGARENGALRYAVKVFRLAIILAQGQRITLELVKATNSLMRGEDQAAVIASQVDAFSRQQKAG